MTALSPSSTDLKGPERDPFEGTGYRKLRQIGAGGMGEVFLIEHLRLGTEFVGKVMRAQFAQDPGVLERMRVEAQALGRLEHPNIVAVKGFTMTADGRPLIIMEYLEGHTLYEELASRGGSFPAAEALNYAIQALDGLGAAHEFGVVHRDVKPDNLFLCAGPEKQLKVLDFGIARVLPTAPAGAPRPISVPTDTGVVVGTPRFISPEGALGRRVDPRADLYALAVTLYTMVAGRGPFDHRAAGGEAAMLLAQAHELPEPPSHYSSRPIPEELEQAILWGLQKDPSNRPQSAAKFRERLVQVASAIDSLGRGETDAPVALSSSEHVVHAPESSGARAASVRPRHRDERANGAVLRGRGKPNLVLLVFAFVVVTAAAAVVTARTKAAFAPAALEEAQP